MLPTTILVKQALTRAGAWSPDRALYVLNAVHNYVHLGWWLRKQGFEIPKRAPSRLAVFERAAAEIADAHVLYLEFGVYQGASIREWSQLLRNPASHLIGFDTFDGLPSSWIQTRSKGHFSTGGAVPVIDDDRVRFVKGLFQDTLPTFEWPEYEVLFINMDADLYSSTIFVLTFLVDRIEPGTFLYFDEFNHRCDELRAFEELLERTGMDFRLLAGTRDLAHLLFERVG